MKKIFSAIELKKKITKQYKKKKIVMCHGVFDLLHIGHINHFSQAKNYGDILIVSVTGDKFVNKGPNRPAFNENIRQEAVAALECVDYVVLSNSTTSVNNLKTIKPNFYCKGSEYKNHSKDISGEIKNEINTLKTFKGKIVYTGGITSSSSKIINDQIKIFSDEQKAFLNKVKNNFSFEKIQKIIEKFKNKKVLVVGETIIDQYNFAECIGKSGKEPHLVLRDMKTEQYIGGSAAIAAHLAQFCKKVDLLTMIGDRGEFLSELKKKLPKNVFITAIKKNNSPTIVKKRYIDFISKNKVLGVYKINDDPLSLKQEKDLQNKFKKVQNKNDLIVVSDYGHGFISNNFAKTLSMSKKFKAVNTQINANNMGHHSLTKYKSLNCVIINEKELRHELRDKNCEIKTLVKVFAKKQNIKDLVLTRGAKGAILYSKSSNIFYESAALAGKVVDKVGSGDTMLSIMALCLNEKVDKNLSLLLGSLAAADAVQNFGNKKTLKKIELLKSIQYILK